MTSTPNRIDLHHHVLPPDFVADLGRRGIEWTGGAGVPTWNISIARETMAKYGIAAAIASVQPQVYWGDTASAAQWARHCNEYLARIVQDDPEHFGGFASVPLPDAASACREAAYALDDLGLDGVLLLTSQDGQYLGDPDFEELFQELDRRSAVVFIHPNTMPPGSDVPKLSLPYSLVEFVFDTTRCIANLLYSGTLERYPSIRYILPHAGGTVPFLAWRIALGEMMVPQMRERVPKGAMHYLRQLYYDTALSTSDAALSALKQFVPTTQIVFGSDFPLAPEPVVKAEIANFDGSPVLDLEARAAINRDNALRLFPRFAQTISPALAR